MSDILIKGMEMPKRCFDCRFCAINDYYYCFATDDEHLIEHMTVIRRRPHWCPLVEVKEGKLIDSTVLLGTDRY